MRKLENLTIGTGHNAITLTVSEVREVLRRLVIERECLLERSSGKWEATMRKIDVDEEYYRLAEHFLTAEAGEKLRGIEDAFQLMELAERIQTAVEDYFGEKDGV
jgi:hypothetical protein